MNKSTIINAFLLAAFFYGMLFCLALILRVLIG